MDQQSGQPKPKVTIKRSEYIPERYEPIRLPFAEDGAGDPGDGSLPDQETWTLDLCARIRAAVDNRFSSGFDNNVRKFRDQYEAVPITRTIPWVGCANLRPPMTLAIVDALTANVYKAIYGANPYFTVDPEDPDDLDDAQNLQDAINSICRSRIPLAKIGRAALKRAFVDGTAVLMPYWHVEVKKKRSWEQITDQLKTDVETLAQGTPDENGTRPDPAQVKAARALLKQIITVPSGEWRTITREEVTHDDAKVDLVDILDFGMYPASVKSIDDAQVLFCRVWYNRDQLYQGVKSGQFDGDAVADLCAGTSQSPGRFADQSGGDRTRFENAGLPTTDTFAQKDEPYECFRGLIKCDADDDGLYEWVLFEVALNEKKLLRAEIYPYFHDQPFFCLVTPYSRDDMPYGNSLVDRLRDLQTELEEIRNQRVDNGTLRNTVSFAMARSVKWNPETKPFTPGMTWTVDNPKTDIEPIELGTTDQAAFTEDALVRTDMMQTAGVNQTILAQSEGGDTTARQNERALEGASTKFDLIIDDTSEGFVAVVRQIVDLYAQYMPDTMDFNAGSATVPVFKQITRQEMQTPCHFSIYGTSELMNAGLQAQIAEKLTMFAQQSPFMADLTRLYAAQRYALQGFGVRNPETFLGSPDNAKQMQEAKENAPPPQPEEKISISERRDEVLTLALALKRGEIDPQGYMAGAQLATAANKVMVPAPQGASVGDATDDAAGYPPQGKPLGPPPDNGFVPSVGGVQ